MHNYTLHWTGFLCIRLEDRAGCKVDVCGVVEARVWWENNLYVCVCIYIYIYIYIYMATCQLGVYGGLGWWQVCAAYAPLCFKHRVIFLLFRIVFYYDLLLHSSSRPPLCSSTSPPHSQTGSPEPVWEPKWYEPGMRRQCFRTGRLKSKIRT